MAPICYWKYHLNQKHVLSHHRLQDWAHARSQGHSNTNKIRKIKEYSKFQKKIIVINCLMQNPSKMIRCYQIQAKIAKTHIFHHFATYFAKTCQFCPKYQFTMILSTGFRGTPGNSGETLKIYAKKCSRRTKTHWNKSFWISGHSKINAIKNAEVPKKWKHSCTFVKGKCFARMKSPLFSAWFFKIRSNTAPNLFPVFCESKFQGKLIPPDCNFFTKYLILNNFPFKLFKSKTFQCFLTYLS